MKFCKLILILIVFVCASASSYCEPSSSQGKLQSRIQLSAPSAVTEKANAYSSINSPYADLTDDAVVNSAINGFGNMIKGFTTSPYNTVEETKQQRDYARQQVNYGRQ